MHSRPPRKYQITPIMGEREGNTAGLKCVPRRSGMVSSAQTLVERHLYHLSASSWSPSGLWVLVLSQLALPDSCALLGRLKSQQRPTEMGIEKKEKNWQSNSHSTEKHYFKECTGMFHIMSQEDPVCTLMKLGFKFSFAVLIFTPASVPLQ